MKKYLLNTEDCYEGYSNEEECYVTASYSELLDMEDVDWVTIGFSDSCWSDAVDYFNEFINAEKAKFEQRYKTSIIGLAMCGTVGRWNGSFVGGKMVDFDNIFQMDVDDIDVSLDSDGTILIRGHHHDGSHCMMLYFLTESNMKRAKIWHTYDELGFKHFGTEDFENIYNYLKPLKMSKNSGYYNYDYYIA